MAAGRLEGQIVTDAVEKVGKERSLTPIWHL
jgi:hypothetical protein